MLGLKPKILIVDDEIDIRETLTGYLGKKGYEVNCAANGKDALTFLSHKSVEAVLLDIVMPQMKGSELAAMIRNRYPKTKIMIITAYPYEGETLEDALEVDALFVKPLKPDEVHTSLIKILNDKGDRATGVAAPREPFKLNNSKLLFVGISTETFEALKVHVSPLTLDGHLYELENARDSREFFQRTKTTSPDIIIIDTSYLNNLDQRLSALIRNASTRILELDLTSLAYATFAQEDFTEKVRTACFKKKTIS
ncbi:MAG: response regulator [Candidatus Omnitrophota bacterium]